MKFLIISFVIILSLDISQLSDVGDDDDIDKMTKDSLLYNAFREETSDAYRTPVVLVPGDGGSRIYIKADKFHGACPPIDFWFHIWLNCIFLLPFTEECFPKYFALNYNATTRKTYDQSGVESKILYWGGTGAIETLDIFHYSSSKYFIGLVESLVEKGYTRDVDIRGAPYDFRRAPNENLDFVPKLKSLIEDTYHKNGQRRVMLLAHSLGNLYTLFFLRKMSPAWKQQYVRGYIAVSPPIAGTLKSLKLVTSGALLSRYILYRKYMRAVERSMPSTPFLFPSPLFWKPDEVLISRPSRNYTVKDYHQLFTDIKFPDGWEMYKDTSHLVDPTWKPDVDELHCIYGHGLNTSKRFVWKSDSDFPDTFPTPIFGDGDGTVSIRSLQVCHSWPNVKVTPFYRADHETILNEDRFIKAITDILSVPDKNGK